MVYIKKDVNKALLFLTLIPIILFVLLSNYYDNKIKTITAEYSQKAKLIQATGNVALENETIKETFLKDKEALEKGYFDIKTENEALYSDKEKLQNELNLVKSQLEEQKSKFDILMKRFQEVQDSLIQANDQISRLSAKNRELCSKAKASDPEVEC